MLHTPRRGSEEREDCEAKVTDPTRSSPGLPWPWPAFLPSFLPWLLRLSRRDCRSSFRFPSRAFARFVREEFGRVQRGGERRGWLVPLVSADRADSPASLSASPPTRACVRVAGLSPAAAGARAALSRVLTGRCRGAPWRSGRRSSGEPFPSCRTGYLHP